MKERDLRYEEAVAGVRVRKGVMMKIKRGFNTSY